MRRSATRWLRAFPRAWRTRYGEELVALIEDLEHDDDLRAIDRLDLVRGGIRMRRLRRARKATLGALAAGATLACALGGLVLSGALSPPTRPPATHAPIVLPTPRAGAGASSPHDALLLPVYRPSSNHKVTVLPATTGLSHARLTVPGG